MILNATGRIPNLERLELGVDRVDLPRESVEPTARSVERAAQAGFVLEIYFVRHSHSVLGRPRRLLPVGGQGRLQEHGERNAPIPFGGAGRHHLLHHTEGHGLVGEDGHFLALDGLARAQPDDAATHLGETRADPRSALLLPILRALAARSETHGGLEAVRS